MARALKMNSNVSMFKANSQTNVTISGAEYQIVLFLNKKENPTRLGSTHSAGIKKIIDNPDHVVFELPNGDYARARYIPRHAHSGMPRILVDIPSRDRAYMFGDNGKEIYPRPSAYITTS